MKLDLAFPVSATGPVAVDHGYAIYSALSRVLPEIHRDNGIGVHPIRGELIGNRQMLLTPRSRLILRVDDSQLGSLLVLSGQELNLGENSLCIGVPQVYPLHPRPTLRTRLATIKGFVEPETFREAVRRQLVVMGVADEAIVTVGKRRTLRIKDKEIIGFEVVLEGLSAEESLAAQEHGVGGRRHMGCGLFASLR